jgi:hypothetical protein
MRHQFGGLMVESHLGQVSKLVMIEGKLIYHIFLLLAPLSSQMPVPQLSGFSASPQERGLHQFGK